MLDGVGGARDTLELGSYMGTNKSRRKPASARAGAGRGEQDLKTGGAGGLCRASVNAQQAPPMSVSLRSVGPWATGHLAVVGVQAVLGITALKWNGSLRENDSQTSSPGSCANSS